MDIKFLKKYIPEQELLTMVSFFEEDEGPFYRELMERLEEKIKAIPPIGSNEEAGLEAKVQLHYFLGATDIYISELDQETGDAFGFTCLNGDNWNAELGYTNIPEIVTIPRMELDLYWDDSTTLREIVDKYKNEYND